MAGQEGRVGREVASAPVISRVLDSVRAPPASGRVVQDRNSQVSAMLGPPDDALSEVALGEQHPSGRGGAGPPRLPSGRGLHSEASGSGPCSWSWFVGSCHFPPNNSSAWASVRVRDRLPEAALREVAGDEFTPTAVPGSRGRPPPSPAPPPFPLTF